MFFRRNRKPVPRKLGIIDYGIFAMILCFAIYYLFQVITGRSRDSHGDWSSIWSVVRYFHISFFDLLIGVILVTILIFLRKKKRRDEEE